jgi:leucyl/phenylalanyl-tRNA--protein transferase
MVRNLQKRNYQLIDCQVSSDHLISLGAVDIPREDFLSRLKFSLEFDTDMGSWNGFE